MLEGIEELAGRLSTPHLLISVHRAGPAVPLPPTVARTIYRVAQEALTNAARHSGAGHVKVHLLCDRAAVTISVTDDGHGRAGAGGLVNTVHTSVITLGVVAGSAIGGLTISATGDTTTSAAMWTGAILATCVLSAQTLSSERAHPQPVRD